MSDLPDPLVPPDVDLRGMPIPRETFAQMAVLQFGMTIDEARVLVDACVDRHEDRRSTRPRRRRRRLARKAKGLPQ